jgi:hypothetical protein
MLEARFFQGCTTRANAALSVLWLVRYARGPRANLDALHHAAGFSGALRAQIELHAVRSPAGGDAQHVILAQRPQAELARCHWTIFLM